MKTFVCALITLAVLGCDSASQDGPASVETGAAKAPGEAISGAVETASAVGEGAQSVEVGCATCIYGMAGVTGCKLAAKVGGTPMLVTGVDLDAHESGLCSSAKKASISGSVDGTRFVASEVTLE